MTVAAMIKAEEGADVGQPQPQKQHQEWTAPDAPKVELSFKGVIAPDELVSLHVLYGDILVCPGLIGAFGSRIDPKGRLRIPGALTGVREAKRCLKGWKKRADESEKLVWWLQKLKERDTEPVTVADILNGITVEAWKKYQKLYSDCVNATAQHRWRQKRRREALEREAQEEAAEAEAAAAAKALKGRKKTRSSAK